MTDRDPAAYMDMYGQVYNPHELNGELRIRYLMKMQDAPTPLYYAPPQREWVGLTDEEIEKIEMSASSILSAIYLAEAQLKGKNAL